MSDQQPRQRRSVAEGCDKQTAAVLNRVADEMERTSNYEVATNERKMAMRVATSGELRSTGFRAYAPQNFSARSFRMRGFQFAVRVAELTATLTDLDNVVFQWATLSLEPSEDLQDLLRVMHRAGPSFLRRSTLGSAWVIAVDREAGKWFVHLHAVVVLPRNTGRHLDREWIEFCSHAASRDRQKVIVTDSSLTKRRPTGEDYARDIGPEGALGYACRAGQNHEEQPLGGEDCVQVGYAFEKVAEELGVRRINRRGRTGCLSGNAYPITPNSPRHMSHPTKHTPATPSTNSTNKENTMTLHHAHPSYVTGPELARATGLSEASIIRYCRDGHIKAKQKENYEIGPAAGFPWKISVEEAERFIESLSPILSPWGDETPTLDEIGWERDRPYTSPREMAEDYGLPIKRILRDCREGRLIAFKPPWAPRLWMIHPAEAQRYAEQQGAVVLG